MKEKRGGDKGVSGGESINDKIYLCGTYVCNQVGAKRPAHGGVRGAEMKK